MKTLFFILSVLLLFSCSPEEITPEPERKVLVLGNSIVWHNPAPHIGWHGNWGMAASAPDKDFISQLSHTVTGKNVAGWENTFQLPEVPTQEYDFIVVRLGENVRDLERFATTLPDLVDLYKSSNTKVIVTGMSWWNEGTDEVLEEFALSNGYIYVSLQGMWGTEYQATEYEVDAVAVHPNDLGHQFIASKINEEL